MPRGFLSRLGGPRSDGPSPRDTRPVCRGRCRRPTRFGCPVVFLYSVFSASSSHDHQSAVTCRFFVLPAQPARKSLTSVIRLPTLACRGGSPDSALPWSCWTVSSLWCASSPPRPVPGKPLTPGCPVACSRPLGHKSCCLIQSDFSRRGFVAPGGPSPPSACEPAVLVWLLPLAQRRCFRECT